MGIRPAGTSLARYATTYPNAWAFSRTRASRVTMVTSCGTSPSSSVVARCTASSVRIGSTGKGRRTRASTARSTSRMKQRRSKVRRARTAAGSCSAVNRPVARARMIARPASARVRADVTCWVPAGGRFMAAVSCSNSAATSALDSMYQTLAPAALDRRARVAVFRVGRRRGTLRFATIAVDQFGGGARRQPDVRPVLERVTGFHWRVENAGRNELVPPTSGRNAGAASWRHEFGDHTPVGGDRNPLTCFDSADVSTQVVFQLSDAGLHVMNIATCGHICNGRGYRRDAFQQLCLPSPKPPLVAAARADPRTNRNRDRNAAASVLPVDRRWRSTRRPSFGRSCRGRAACGNCEPHPQRDPRWPPRRP